MLWRGLSQGASMRRREFIVAVGGAATMPLAARAQQSAAPVIGFLRSTTAASSVHLVTAFREGLRESGFVEGQNITIEYRFADNQPSRLPALAGGLVGHPVMAIVANDPAAFAAKAVTSSRGSSCASAECFDRG
jgi:putative tryptophan/tyrosine transport system substrate-binding protein